MTTALFAPATLTAETPPLALLSGKGDVGRLMGPAGLCVSLRLLASFRTRRGVRSKELVATRRALYTCVETSDITPNYRRVSGGTSRPTAGESVQGSQDVIQRGRSAAGTKEHASFCATFRRWGRASFGTCDLRRELSSASVCPNWPGFNLAQICPF